MRITVTVNLPKTEVEEDITNPYLTLNEIYERLIVKYPEATSFVFVVVL